MSFLPHSLATFVQRLRGRSAASVAARDVGHPERDWSYLIIATALLLLVAVGISSLTLLQDSEYITTRVDPVVVDSLDQDVLAQTIAELRERRARFESLKGKPPVLVDPSR